MNESGGAPVVVAGAGPVGLSMALGLSSHAVRTVVVEAKPEASPHSRAPLIAPRTLEALRSWGALERLLREGTLLRRVDIWVVGEDGPAATLDLGVIDDISTVGGALILPQNRTEALLLEEIWSGGRADVRFGHRLESFREEADGVVVRVRPPNADPYELRASYLVGCDGAHSTVRAELGWSLEGKTYPTRMLLGDVRLPDARNELPWPRLAPRHNGVLAGLRIEPSLWRIIAALPPDEPDEQALSNERLAARVEALFGAGPFERVWADTFSIHCRTSPRFRRGRVLLAGDAAHVNSPAGGQGMNAGIHDAQNLAWKLARILEGGAVQPLLSSYEAERRGEVVHRVEAVTDLLTRAALLAPEPARGAFGWAARRALQSAIVTRWIAPHLGMLVSRYHASPLLAGSGRWLGARPPDGWVEDASGQVSPLFDRANRDALLLTFGAPRRKSEQRALAEVAAAIPHVAIARLLPQGSRAEPGDLVDARGTLMDAWDVEPGTVALLRPDGHVGFMSRRDRPVAEIARGLERAIGAVPRKQETRRAA